MFKVDWILCLPTDFHLVLYCFLDFEKDNSLFWMINLFYTCFRLEYNILKQLSIISSIAVTKVMVSVRNPKGWSSTFSLISDCNIKWCTFSAKFVLAPSLWKFSTYSIAVRVPCLQFWYWLYRFARIWWAEIDPMLISSFFSRSW